MESHSEIIVLSLVAGTRDGRYSYAAVINAPLFKVKM